MKITQAMVDAAEAVYLNGETERPLEEIMGSIIAAVAPLILEEAAKWIEQGYRCRTCQARFLEQDGHPEPPCDHPNWDKLSDDDLVRFFRARAALKQD